MKIASHLAVWSALALASCNAPQTATKPAAQQPAPPKAGKTPDRNVAILVYKGMELLDFAGLGEVFADTPGFKVYPVAVAPSKARAS
jgi:hypothetical protein